MGERRFLAGAAFLLQRQEPLHHEKELQMTCPSCGAENADSAAFCTNCGAAIVPSAPDSTDKVSPPAKPEPKPRTIIDRLPNAAEDIVRSALFAAWCLFSLQLAAVLFGGPSRALIGSLPGLLVLPIDLLFVVSFWNGLDRNGSPAAKSAGVYALLQTVIVAIWVFAFGLFLVAGNAGALSDAAIRSLRPAIAVLVAFCVSALVAAAFLFRSVRKNHDGRIRGVTTLLLVWTVAFPAIPLLLLLSPILAGCGAVAFHGVLAVFLSRILSRADTGGADVRFRIPGKATLAWIGALAVVVFCLHRFPSNIPLMNPVADILSGGTTAIIHENFTFSGSEAPSEEEFERTLAVLKNRFGNYDRKSFSAQRIVVDRNPWNRDSIDVTMRVSDYDGTIEAVKESIWRIATTPGHVEFRLVSPSSEQKAQKLLFLAASAEQSGVSDNPYVPKECMLGRDGKGRLCFRPATEWAVVGNAVMPFSYPINVMSSEFVPPAPSLSENEQILFEASADSTLVPVFVGSPKMSNVSVKEAKVGGDPGASWKPCVRVKLDGNSAQQFSELTAKYCRSENRPGRQLAICVDGIVLSAPVLLEPIQNGEFLISFDSPVAAKRLCAVLAGELPKGLYSSEGPLPGGRRIVGDLTN